MTRCWQYGTPTSPPAPGWLRCAQSAHPYPTPALPSTTGGVLLFGGASGVEVGGKRTLKSQNWDVGCRSSNSVSNATTAPLLPMASSAGSLRTSPSKTAFYIFLRRSSQQAPGLQGRGELQGAGRDGEEGRGGPKVWPCGHAMPCQGSPVVPGDSPCPQSSARGCQQSGLVNLPASRCLGVLLLCAGVVAVTRFPLLHAPRVTPQGCLLPTWGNAAPHHSSWPRRGAWHCPSSRADPKPLGDTGAGTGWEAPWDPWQQRVPSYPAP